MSSQQKVVIVTGASQGIGAELIKAFHDRNYRVIANSRSIKPSSDADVLNIAGDIAIPATADRIVSEGSLALAALTPLSTMRVFSSLNPSSITRRRTIRPSLRPILVVFPSHEARGRRNVEARFRAHRADHDLPCRSSQQQRAGRPCRNDQGWPQCRNAVARN